MSARHVRPLSHWLRLEDRLSPAVVPLTIADPSRLGLSAAGTSKFLSASADGQIIAFQSDAPDLVANDFNGQSDVFVYFRSTGRVELASVSLTGVSGKGNSGSQNPKVSPDGRYVLFESGAEDLLPGTPPFVSQLYARDLQTQTTVLVSTNDAGQFPGRGSTGGSWSADSTRVVFQSDWGGFVPNDVGGQTDVFLRDLVARTTIRVSEAKDGTEAIPGASFFGDLSRNAQISDNGRFVVFESFAKNLGPTDSNTFNDIYIKDLQTGAVDLATVDTAGVNQASANAQIFGRPISADGRYVVFQAPGGKLAPGANANDQQAFVRDRVAGTTTLLSATPGGAGRAGFAPVITPDGRYAAFVSTAGDLDSSLAPYAGEFNVFRRDLSDGTTRLISVDKSGTKGGAGRSGFGVYPNIFTVVEPVISPDGRFVLFPSDATDLTSDADVPGLRDLFLRDLQAGQTTIVSKDGNGTSHTPATSADLSVIAFETIATNLFPGDRNGLNDLVVRDPAATALSLISRREPLLPSTRTVGGTLSSITPNGRFVGFTAGSTKDYAPDVTFTAGTSAYVRDTLTGAVTVVDLATDGKTSVGGSNPVLTPDGRYVAFTSGSQSIVEGITYVGPVGGFFSTDVYLRDLATGVTRIVSVDPTGQQSQNGRGVGEVAISADGRYVAFTSTSSNLVPGLTNPGEKTAVYLRDTWSNMTVLVSHPLAGGAITNNAFNVSLSADGRYVTFVSQATDLVANDTNGVSDVFQWDRQSGLIALVSAAVGGGPGNGESGEFVGNRPAVTPDGRYVAFGSRATNLTHLSDSGGTDFDVFVRDMQTGVTTLVSVNPAGTGAAGGSRYPSISADGKRVAFLGELGNLVSPSPQFPNHSQAYVRDLTTGITSLVSVTPDGKAPNGNITISVGGPAVDEPTISPDGTRVAFRSTATDLVPGFVDHNGAQSDVYVRELNQGFTRLVTANQSGSGGSAGDGNGLRFLFSADSKVLYFDTKAQDVIPGDRNGTSDVFAFTAGGTGSISGTLFRDLNGNGKRDGGEPGLGGQPVFLDANGNGRPDFGESRAQTDAAGSYTFRDLGAGTYAVGSLFADGLRRTTPAIVPVTLAKGTTAVAGVDFGAVAANVDLVVETVSGPASVAAGRAFNVSWTVKNTGSSATGGDWQDAIYLSADATLDANDLLLGTAPHVGGLGAGASYAQTATFATPAALAGHYFVFVRTDRRSQVTTDENRSNNLGRSFDASTVAIPSLALGVPAVDSFHGANQDRYFQITLTAGQAVRLTLDSSAANGGTELYASFGRLPTPFEFDHGARSADVPDQRLSIPITRPGTYFVLARSRFGAAATAGFTLTADTVTFALESVGPAMVAAGPITLDIRGTALTPNVAASLIRNGVPIPATAIDFRDPTRLFATFDLGQAAAGLYDVRLSDGVRTDTLTNGVAVVMGPAVENPLRLTLDNPAQVRAGRAGTTRIEYENVGATDIAAPLLTLTATNALLRLPGDPVFDRRTVTVLGIAADGPAGILRPGQRGSVVVEFLSDGPANVDIEFRTDIADVGAAANLVTQKDALRPAQIRADAWDAIYANFLLDAGTTVGDFQALLGRAANHLSSVGADTPDVRLLFGFLLNEAQAAGTAGNLVVLDSRLDAPGDDLAFLRSYRQSIADRYEVGVFGRGWTSNWDVRLEIDLQAETATVIDGDTRRTFTLQNGFQGGPGEYGMLTNPGTGALRYTAPDGSLIQFDVNGRLDYREDAKGNRVTAGYVGFGPLTTLTHSSGAVITLAYNAQGRISQLSDSAGRRVTYSYDATGEHLLAYSDRFGTHTYTYAAGQGAAREHALMSINYSDDTHVNLSYDTRGRLTESVRDGGQQRQTFAYALGRASATDAVGGTTTQLFDAAGRAVRVIDPLGRTADVTYDRNGKPVRAAFGGGIESRAEYDSRGNLVRSIDPTGTVSTFAYNAVNLLTAATDRLGRTTAYSYDAERNLVGIVHADGTTSGFTYDGAGNTLTARNRRGQTVTYARDTAGRVTKLTTPEGVTSYVYDDAGRVKTATDATGTIAFTYSGTDALANVSFPDGRFLQFTTNSVGQRTQSQDQDGFTVNYAYDDLGRLDTLTDGTGALIVDYTRDAAGRIIREDRGNGTATVSLYDAAGNRHAILHLAPGGATSSKYAYTYDAFGRRATETLTDTDPATPDGTTTYGYDALGRLITVAPPTGPTVNYQYDAVGNRISDSLLGDYVTNDADQYTRIGDTFYGYDADGNLVTKTDGAGTTIYRYDALNRLVGATGTGLEARFTIDALGNRSAATVNGLTTRYLNDVGGFGTVVGEYDGGGKTLANTVYGVGLVSRVGAGGAAYFEFDDALNTTAVTNAAGQVVNRYGYAPFGVVTTFIAGVNNPFTFLGQIGARADVGGLFDIGGAYDPMAGRYVSVAAFGLNAGPAYRFAGNAPTALSGVNLPATGAVGDTLNTLFNALENLYKSTTENLQQQIQNESQQQSQAQNQTLNQTQNAIQQLQNEVSLAKQSTASKASEALNKFLDGGEPPPPPPGNTPGSPGKNGALPSPSKTQVIASSDPNDIVGPAGFGNIRFVTPDRSLGYTIRFENVSTATAAAQEVFVTHALDADLDPSTVAIGSFGFANQTVSVPAGLAAFATRLNATNPDGSPLFVDVTVEVDAQAGVIRWTFRAVDPNTGLLPAGALDGFLAPEDGTGRGQGFVTYTVRPKAGVPTTTQFNQQASIVFDTNAAIATNVFVNAVDRDAPTSSVLPLAATTTNPNFTVSWSGSDFGSGVATFDLFVSTNGGPFVLLLDDTTKTSTTFAGQVGNQYAFSTLATDNVGLTQPTPTGAQATTQVIDPVSPPPPPPPPPPAGPSPLLVGFPQTAVGTGTGGRVRFFNADQTERFSLQPFPGFTGSVRTAAADLTGDGIAELIVGTGPGIATDVRVFDGATQQSLFEIAPFEAAFVGGIYIAAGDVTGDGIADSIITPDEGGGPRVRIFDGRIAGTGTAAAVADYFGIDDPAFRGGARAAASDMTGDGRAEVIVAAGFLGGPRITIWDGASVAKNAPSPLANFFAFEQTLRNGTFVTAGDFTGDGRADLAFGGGPGGGPRVRIFDGVKLLAAFSTVGFVSVDEIAGESQVANFFAGNPDSRGGVRLAVKDLDGDAQADLVTGAGTGAGGDATAYRGNELIAANPPAAVFILDAFDDLANGVFVG